MDSDQPPSTSTAPSSSAIMSPTSDVAVHCSCQLCSRRMSSYWGGGGGVIEATSLLRGRLIKPSGMVPSSQVDVNSPISVSVHDVNYGRLSVDTVSGFPFPTIGRDNINLSSGMDQLHVRGESNVPSVASVSAVRDVSLSSLFNPSSLLFPLADSGVSSFSSSLPLSTPVSSSSSSFGLSTVAPSVPPSPVPIFFLPFVVPSLHPASSLAPSSSSSLLMVPSASLPPPPPLSFSSSSFLAPPPLAPSSVFPSSASTLRPSFPFSCSSSSSLSSGGPPAPPSSSALPPASFSPGDFASFQASVLGLSAEY